MDWKTIFAAALIVGCANPPPQTASTPTSALEEPQMVAAPLEAATPEVPAPVNISFDEEEREYPWLKGGKPGEPLWDRFEPPAGFRRIETVKGSFGNWLRHLPLKPGKPDVMLHDGSPKGRQDVHAAVLDVDVGRRDLQQCVDACMRLRAEYLWSARRAEDVCFTSVGGLDFSWKKWRQGFRPDGRKWSKAASPQGNWRAFRSYMDKAFGICNTRSQLGQMIPLGDPEKLEIGHVFLNRPNPDFYGHAVMVVDMASNTEGKTAFLLVQSYMPAQEIHVLNNLSNQSMSPWFTLEDGRDLVTPEWTFAIADLMRYPEKGCSE